MIRTWFLLAVGLTLAWVQASAQEQARAQPRVPYLPIVEQYLAGEFERAVEGLASHSQAHAPAFAIQELRGANPEISNPFLEQFPAAKQEAFLVLARLLPAASALHLETGRHLLLKADEKRGLGHLTTAQAIVDNEWWTTVAKMFPDRVAAFDAMRLDIYRGIVYTLQQQHQFEALLPHLDRARQLYPNDAGFRLALGSVEELRASAVMLRRVELPGKQNRSESWHRNQRREYLDKAADRYREALNLDATLVEARVRLGRVLRERGKLPEARRELEAAVKDVAAATAEETAATAPPAATAATGAPFQPVPYLALLFLGDVIEAQGNKPGAIARYQRMVKQWPDCQSARMALSSAFEASGDRRAAADALEPLWSPEADRKCPDPWWHYNTGQAWRMEPLIEDLRARARDKA